MAKSRANGDGIYYIANGGDVQAAIDALPSTGGTLILDQTYTISTQSTDLERASYDSIRYDLVVTGSNITIDGRNTGQLVHDGVDNLNASGQWAGICVGNGHAPYTNLLSEYGSVANWLTQGICENVTIKNITLDYDACTLAHRQKTIGASAVVGGSIVFFGVDNSSIENVTIKNGFGINAVITTISVCRTITIDSNTLTTPLRYGVWIDGAQDHIVSNNTMSGFDEDLSAGINIAANTDALTNATNCMVTDNTISGVHIGIAPGGIGHTISGNSIDVRNSGATRFGISIAPARIKQNGAQVDVYPTKTLILSNNTITRDGAVSRLGFCLDIGGASQYGETSYVEDVTITGTVMDEATLLRLVQLKSYVRNLTVSSSVNSEAGAVASGNLLFDASSPGTTENVSIA